jgi:hypothetical protein
MSEYEKHQDEEERVEDLDVDEEDAGSVKGGMPSADAIKEKMMKDPGSK